MHSENMIICLSLVSAKFSVVELLLRPSKFAVTAPRAFASVGGTFRWSASKGSKDPVLVKAGYGIEVLQVAPLVPFGAENLTASQSCYEYTALRLFLCARKLTLTSESSTVWSREEQQAESQTGIQVSNSKLVSRLIWRGI